MANYQNSLGESELFGRMTAGFAKVCESVQSGKFVRNEMGVICESVCEDDENAGAAPEAGTEGVAPEGETADAGATADAGTEGATQDADVASATPEQINGSVTECGNAEKKPLKKLIPEGCCGGKAKKVIREGVIGSTLGSVGGTIAGGLAGHPIIGGAVGGAIGNRIGDAVSDMVHGRKGDERKQNWKRDLAAAAGGAVTGALGGGAVDALKTGTVVTNPTALGKVAGTAGALAGGAAKGSAGAIAGGILGAAAGNTATAMAIPATAGVSTRAIGKSILDADNKGKKTNESAPKVGKKMLAEGVKLCKTCGNPLDETGTCQDCQGYSEVKEGDGEIKLQVPASVQRRANLKVNAKANQEKVAQAIRDGKADGIVKEGEAKTLPEGVQLLMGIIDKAFKLERGGSCPGEVPINRIESGLEKKEPFSSGVLVKLNKDGKMSCCGVDDEGEYHLDELIVDDIINEAGKRGLKVKFSPHHLDGFDGTFRIVDDSEFKNRTVEEAENAYVVKKGSIGYYVKDVANDKAVSPSFDTKEEAEQYLKDKFPANEKVQSN